MTLFSSPEYAVLILAPYGNDAAGAAEVLKREGLYALPIKSLGNLYSKLRDGPIGALLVAEEALTFDGARELKEVFSGQETWSNLPIILMTSQKERFFTTENLLELFGMVGSITLLERPFRIMTFVASVRVALKARERQYEVRKLLIEQKHAIDEQLLALQKRDDFLSVASHELKTPLTSLKLQMHIRKKRLLKGDYSHLSLENSLAHLNVTENQLDRLAHLVDDMLDVTRVINGKLSLNLEATELGGIVEEVFESFNAQFQTAECVAEIKIESRAQGEWDRFRIEQVVANLFTNVIKYGAGKPVSVTVKLRNDLAVLIVKDGGIGIAPHEQERIFQRFERVNPESGIGGLGLGLFITRQIVELHKGFIRVESELGKGSTFTVELPAKLEKKDLDPIL